MTLDPDQWRPDCQLSVSHLGVWSETFVLLAPFPDLCLLFHTQMMSTLATWLCNDLNNDLSFP